MSDASFRDELDEETFVKFRALVHRLTGITLPLNRKMMLTGRLRPRMRELGMADFPTYLKYVESQSEETPRFIDLVTTNETYFFRTPRVWDYLEQEFLPQWIQKHPRLHFYAWSAAASSGAEACSLGILLQQFHEKNPDFQYQILGTDISGEILETAEKGIYNGRFIEAFRSGRPEIFQKYMVPAGDDGYTLVPEIRARLRFQRHNLFARPDFKVRFDLVLIRNVLIYFAPPDQEKVLAQASTAMKEDALLIIGESESLNRLETPLLYKRPLIYSLKGEAA